MANPLRRPPRVPRRAAALPLLLVLVSGGGPNAEMGRPVPGQGEPRGGARIPPFDMKDEGIIREGAALFARTCGVGYCHGAEGRQGGGPKLRGRKLDPEYLFDTITNGKRLMPPWGHLFSPEQVWQLVAYIKSLEGVKDDP